MKKKKLEYIGEEKRIIPQFGVYKPGDEVDYSKPLESTGLFRLKTTKEKEEGDK